jgi:heterotetrameric sarcosine oxidase gamma subunit
MTEASFSKAAALDMSHRSARLGPPAGAAGVRVVQRSGLSIAILAARKDRTGALAARMLEETGLVLPERGRRIDTGEASVLWSGPSQWLVQAPAGVGRFSAASLATRFGADAAITDQSDARAVFRLSGDRVLDVLSKGIMIDLHPRVFTAGMTAITVLAHIGVQLSATQAGVFECLVPRSFAESFWDWLVHSGSQYGLELATEAADQHG